MREESVVRGSLSVAPELKTQNSKLKTQNSFHHPLSTIHSSTQSPQPPLTKNAAKKLNGFLQRGNKHVNLFAGVVEI
jgi:hypothetical protein